MGYGVCVINSSYSFQWIILKPCTLVVDILKMCMWIFAGVKIIFDKITAFWTLTIFRLGFNLDLDNFQVRFQYGVANLCNQLLPEFSSNQFETLHRYYKHIEDVHVISSRQENYFWQNYAILDLDNFQVRLQYWVVSLSNQLVPEFSSNQFETLHRC